MTLKKVAKNLKLVLVRHGQSTWNLENKFTGWKDVPLSEIGLKEAVSAGKLLRNEELKFDMVFTSYLRRAIDTYHYISKELDCQHLPVYKTWRLNERHYGNLTGLNKKETAEEYGDKQVKIWRRSFDIPPPLLDKDDSRCPHFDEKYESVCGNILPLGESLKCTMSRVMPYYYDNIITRLLKNQRILIVAHGNSLRSIVKELEGISDSDITELNIPTGVPLVYSLDSNLNILNKKFLGDQEELRKKMEEVAKQGSKN